MKLPYKLDSMELRNCNIGCRSACMYVLFIFFCSFSCFPDGFAVRNWSSRHPHESRHSTGTTVRKEFLSANRQEKSLFLTKGSCRWSRQESYSWRYFRHSWWFLAVRSFPFSGSGGCLDSKIGTSSCTEKTWMSAGHGDLGCVLSNSGYWAWKWTSALWHYYLGLESRSGDLSMNRHVYTTWTPLSSYSGKGTEPLYCMQDRIVDRRWTAIIIPDRLDS